MAHRVNSTVGRLIGVAREVIADAIGQGFPSQRLQDVVSDSICDSHLETVMKSIDVDIWNEEETIIDEKEPSDQ